VPTRLAAADGRPPWSSPGQQVGFERLDDPASDFVSYFRLAGHRASSDTLLLYSLTDHADPTVTGDELVATLRQGVPFHGADPEVACPELSVFRGGNTASDDYTYRMETFWPWLSRFRLLEATWFTFDAKQYDRLFNGELEKAIARVRDPACRQSLEGMQGFEWTGYIAAMVRRAGCRDRREQEEKTHEVVVKLLMGTLFRGYDERRHGPMDRRFKCAVANSIRNVVAKEQTRRRYLPSVSIGQEFEPGGVTAEELPARSPTDDEKIIEDFRNLLRNRLGGLAVAVLDARLGGEETKSLIGNPSLGSPGKWIIKRLVCQVKQLAREFAASLGDPELLRRIEKAMAGEEATVAKRQAATAARQAVGA
jgi:hypothetical protein